MLQIKSIADTFPVTTQTSWHIASDLITTAGEERGSIATEYLFTQGLSTVVDLRSRFPVVTTIGDAMKMTTITDTRPNDLTDTFEQTTIDWAFSTRVVYHEEFYISPETMWLISLVVCASLLGLSAFLIYYCICYREARCCAPPRLGWFGIRGEKRNVVGVNLHDFQSSIPTDRPPCPPPRPIHTRSVPALTDMEDHEGYLEPFVARGDSAYECIRPSLHPQSRAVFLPSNNSPLASHVYNQYENMSREEILLQYIHRGDYDNNVFSLHRRRHRTLNRMRSVSEGEIDGVYMDMRGHGPEVTHHTYLDLSGVTSEQLGDVYSESGNLNIFEITEV